MNELQELLDAGYTEEQAKEILGTLSGEEQDKSVEVESPVEETSVEDSLSDIDKLLESGYSQEDAESIAESFETPQENLINPSIGIRPIAPESIYELASKYDKGEDQDSDSFLEYFNIFDLATDTFGYIKQGWGVRAQLNETGSLFAGYADDEDVNEYVEAVRNAETITPPSELTNFYKDIEECGGGAYCALKASFRNPSALFGVGVTSLVQMTNNPTLGGAAAIFGAGLLASAPTGGASIPIAGRAALGYASATTDALASFTDFLREELGDKEFNEANIKAILDDPDKIGRIRTRAASRGAVIGLVDALTLSVASSVGSKIGKTALKAATAKSLGAGLTIEAVGGSLGEFGGQLAAGQEIDGAEILIEGLAEPFGIGGITSVKGAFKNPKYTVNGARVNQKDVSDFVKYSTFEEINKANINISNDDKIKNELDFIKAVKEVDSSIDPIITDKKERSKTVAYQSELYSLKDNDSEVAKSRKKILRDSIQKIYSKYDPAEEYIPPNDKPQAEPKSNHEQIYKILNPEGTYVPTGRVVPNRTKVDSAISEYEGAIENNKTFKGEEGSTEQKEILKTIDESKVNIKKLKDSDISAEYELSDIKGLEVARQDSIDVNQTSPLTNEEVKSIESNVNQQIENSDTLQSLIEDETISREELVNATKLKYYDAKYGTDINKKFVEGGISEKQSILKSIDNQLSTDFNSKVKLAKENLEKQVTEAEAPKAEAKVDTKAEAPKAEAKVDVKVEASKKEAKAEEKPKTEKKKETKKPKADLDTSQKISHTDPFVKKVVKKVEGFFGRTLDVEIKAAPKKGLWGEITERDGRLKLIFYKNEEGNVKLDTLLHEPAHVLYQIVQNSKDPKLKEIYGRINNLIVDTKEYQEISNDKNYSNLSEEGIKQEAFARYFGKIASSKLYKYRSSLDKAIKELFDYISRTFGVEINPSNFSLSQISSLLLSDLSSGNPVLINVTSENVLESYRKSAEISSTFSFKDIENIPNEQKRAFEKIKSINKKGIARLRGKAGNNDDAKVLRELSDEELTKRLMSAEAIGLQDISSLTEETSVSDLMEEYNTEEFGYNFYENSDSEARVQLVKVWSSMGEVLTEDLLSDDLTVFEKKKIKLAAGRFAFRTLVEDKVIDITPSGTDERATYDAFVKNQELIDNFIRVMDRIPGAKPVHRNVVTNGKPEIITEAVSQSGFKAFGKRNNGSGMNDENSPKVFKALNKLIQTAFKINTDVKDVLKATLDNDNLDPSTIEFKKGDPRYYKEYSSMKAKKRARDLAILKAEDVGDSTFYSYWKRADQGRYYSTSDFLNIQGGKGSRAMHYLETDKKIGKFGYKRMKIQAVDFFGLPGDTFAKREAIFEENKSEWAKWAKDPIKNQGWKEAKEPELFLATIMEIKKAEDSGSPTNFVSGLPIWGDASSSGPQLMAFLLGDSKLGRYVNLTAEKLQQDLYSYLGVRVLGNTSKPSVEDVKRHRIYQNALDKFEKKSERLKREKKGLLSNAETSKEKKAILKKYNKKINDNFYDKVYFSRNPENELNQRSYAKVEIKKNFKALSESIRDIFKYPVMIVGYSAGVPTMAKNIFNAAKNKSEANIDYDTALVMAEDLNNLIKDEFPAIGKFMDAVKYIASSIYKKGQVRLRNTIKKKVSDETIDLMGEFVKAKSKAKGKDQISLRDHSDKFVYAEAFSIFEKAKGKVSKDLTEVDNAATEAVKSIRSEFPKVDTTYYGQFSFDSGVDGFRFVQNQTQKSSNRISWRYNGSDADTLARASSGTIFINYTEGSGPLDPNGIRTAIVSELIQNLDSQIISSILLDSDFNSVSVHDDFASVPGDSESLYKKKREALKKVAGGGKLQEIFAQALGDKSKAKELYEDIKTGDLNEDDSLTNDGAFDGGNVSSQENVNELTKYIQDRKLDNREPFSFQDVDGDPSDDGYVGRPLSELPKFTNNYKSILSDQKIADLRQEGLAKANKAGFLKNNSTIKYLNSGVSEDFKGLSYLIRDIVSEETSASLHSVYADNFKDHRERSNNIRSLNKEYVSKLNKEGIKLSAASPVEVKGVKITVGQAIQKYIDENLGNNQLDLFSNESNPTKDYIESNATLKEYVTKFHKKGVFKESPKGRDFTNNSIVISTDNYIKSDLWKISFSDFTSLANETYTADVVEKIFESKGEEFLITFEAAIDRMSTGNVIKRNKEGETIFAEGFLRGAVGVTMFLNFRSASNQLLSIPNIIFSTDKKGKVLANLLNFPKTFKLALKMFNHPYLKERRAQAGISIEATDIAQHWETSNSYAEFFRKLLVIGFTPTILVDSFSIAYTGAALLQAEGNTNFKNNPAIKKWIEASEDSQQSSRPDKVSKQQTSNLGRFVLTYANTPLQYFRLSREAYRDIKDGKNVGQNLAKIGWYMFVQNLIFTAASSMKDALLNGFGDPEDDEEEFRQINSMLDSILRGMGLLGALMNTIKNIGAEFYVQQKYKDQPDFRKVADKAWSIAPQFDKKNRDLRGVFGAFEYKDGLEAYTESTAKALSFFNIPAEWLYYKWKAVENLWSDQYTAFEKALMIRGHRDYEFKEKLTSPLYNLDYDFGDLDLDLDFDEFDFEN